MRNICRVFATFTALLVGVGLVNAQSSSSTSSGTRGSDRPSPPEAPSSREPRSTGGPGAKPVSPDTGLRFISSEMSFGGKLVKGIPYSAETLTENTQILNNGVKLKRQTTGMVYRDDEGRTRRELSGSTAGPFATIGDTRRLIFINDPVA